MDFEDTEQKQKNSGILNCKLNPENEHISLQVFGNKKLLKSIFENLSRKELLHLRSLNQTWNAQACQTLCKRNWLCLFITFPYHARNETEEEQALSKRIEANFLLLTKTMARSTELKLEFPPFKYFFNNFELQNAAIQNFFSSCGHVITKMHASIPRNLLNDGCKFMHLLTNLLFNQLTNLSQLIIYTRHSLENYELGNFEQLSLTNGSPQEARVLPKLKRFEFSNSESASVIKRILEAAINLEDIRMVVYGDYNDTKIGGIVAIIETGKTHLLSSLDLILDRHLLEPIESLSETNLRIKKLELDLEKEGMSDECELKAKIVVNKLFHSVAQSLEKLESYPLLMYQALNVPQMPKLHYLNLTYIGPCRPLYPTNFKMSVSFPRLKSLKIFISFCKHLDPGMFNESFLGASYADQVFSLTSVEINKQPGDLCVQNFPKMFPNIVSLNMGSLFNIPLAFKAFWSLAYLRKLEMIVIRGSPNDEGFNFENMALELEAGLTGFSTEICEQLALDFENVDLTTVEVLRVNRSMLDAKCLKKLIIKVYDCQREERTVARSPLFSQVTGQFAFKMCPQVQVYIKVYAFNKKNMAALMTDVNPVADYVASVVEANYGCGESSIRFSPCIFCDG